MTRFPLRLICRMFRAILGIPISMAPFFTRDGDVVFNFENGGLVRIDRCSRVKWRIAQQTHHSVAEDADGNLWVPGRRLRTKPVKEYPNVPAPFQEEYILKCLPTEDPQGNFNSRYTFQSEI